MENIEQVRSFGSMTDVDWPAAVEFPEERVLSGEPSASTYVLYKDASTEVGLWRVSPGHFASSRVGMSETITVSSGQGRLLSDDGTVTELKPGVSVVIPNGWTGSWDIESELVKTYAIVKVAG